MQFLFALAAFAALTSAAALGKREKDSPCPDPYISWLNEDGQDGTDGGWQCKSGKPKENCVDPYFTTDLPYYICALY